MPDPIAKHLEVLADALATPGEGRRPSAADFSGEVNCACGFMLDKYDDGRYRIEYADPDTGLVVDRCPDCRRYLNLRVQR